MADNIISYVYVLFVCFSNIICVVNLCLVFPKQRCHNHSSANARNLESPSLLWPWCTLLRAVATGLRPAREGLTQRRLRAASGTAAAPRVLTLWEEVIPGNVQP